MPVVSAERFASGMTWADYLAGVSIEEERRRNGYASVTFTPEQERVLERIRGFGLKVLVLEEDWCGDAARSAPVLARIAEAAGMEARWFLRDQNLDIMDQFLDEGGGRAIPVFVFMDQNGEYLTRWGSRPTAVAAVRGEWLPSMPPKEDPAYPEALERMRQAMREEYDRNYPAAIVDELLACMTRVLP